MVNRNLKLKKILIFFRFNFVKRIYFSFLRCFDYKYFFILNKDFNNFNYFNYFNKIFNILKEKKIIKSLFNIFYIQKNINIIHTKILLNKKFFKNLKKKIKKILLKIKNYGFYKYLYFFYAKYQKKYLILKKKFSKSILIFKDYMFNQYKITNNYYYIYYLLFNKYNNKLLVINNILSIKNFKYKINNNKLLISLFKIFNIFKYLIFKQKILNKDINNNKNLYKKNFNLNNFNFL